MGQLNNLYVSSSYQGLLKMTDSTNGLTNTLQTVQTGDGDNSPLQMSLTQVNISGSFSVNGIVITGSTSGSSGTSGTSGSNGSSGTSGTSGSSGSGFTFNGAWDNTVTYNLNDVVTYGGQSYVSIQGGNLNKQPSVQPAWWTVFSAAGSSGTSGTSGTSGSSGSSGTSGSSGSSGTSGSSGSSGTSGTSGSSGSSGTSGQNGSSGTSGTSGTSGSSGSSGTSGTSGSDGSSGTSGTSGSSGSSGTSGTSGSSGSSGTSGDSIFALTGSVWNATKNVGVTGSLYADGNLYNLSLNTTVQPDTYLTSSQAGQVNQIKGWGENLSAGAGAVQANYTGSLRITGSNNIVSLPQIRSTGFGGGVDLSGYISGSDNTIQSNFSGLYLNTGSQLFPKTVGNYIGYGSYINMSFTTSSLSGGHPSIFNNTIYGGNATIFSNSGSLTSFSGNLINGGNITSTQNFVTNTRPIISTNLIEGSIALSHISSSINYQNNFNVGDVNVVNHLSSSIANNSLTVNYNQILTSNTNLVNIYVSGSQNTNGTRTISRNLLGGASIVVSSSFVSSSNSNLLSSIIYGNSLAVSASHTAGTFGGSAFFGRFNATGSNLEDAQQVVFAVGTGTAAGSRKTAFLIDSGSYVRVSGSLAVQGTESITGSLVVSGSLNAVVVSGSMDIRHNIAGQNALIVRAQALGQPGLLVEGDTVLSGSLAVTGNVQFASGSNKTMGTFVLDGGNPGVATVSNSLVTANSLIFLTKQTNGNSGNGTVSVTSKGTGTFSVTSNHNGDADTVAYLIVNPS